MKLRVLIARAASAALLGVFLAGAFFANASAAPAVPTQSATAEPNGPQVVEVGAVPITIYGVDQENGTYFGDFYIWLRWKGPINPVDSTEILNSVEKWGTTLTKLEPEPVQQPDGYYYQSSRLDGRFDNNFALGRYPLDRQSLNLVVENTTYAADKLVYRPAPAAQLQVEDNLEVQGWTVGSWTTTEGVHTYNSDFGQPSASRDYSQVSFSLELSRPPSYFAWKLLLPLSVVIFMGLTALLIAGELVEARIAMPSTAILAAVFLQLTYTEDLPMVTGLVLMDDLYVIAYGALVAVLVRTVLSSYKTKKAGTGEYSSRRWDLITLASVVVFLLTGFLAVVLFAT